MNLNLKTAKQYFFDSPKVIRAVERTRLKVLRHQGGYLAKVARSLMIRSRKSSLPGNPPRSHQGQLRRFLLYAYDPSTKSVVVGPVRLGRSRVPATLEHGGTVPAPPRLRRRGIKTSRILPRPFMTVAFDRVKEKLPTFWKDAL